MIEKNKGFFSLLKNSESFSHLIGLHCFIHVESLCSKYGTEQLDDIVGDVAQVINFIKSKSLVHREFSEFLKEMDSDNSELLYYTGKVNCKLN